MDVKVVDDNPYQGIQMFNRKQNLALPTSNVTFISSSDNLLIICKLATFRYLGKPGHKIYANFRKPQDDSFAPTMIHELDDLANFQKSDKAYDSMIF